MATNMVRRTTTVKADRQAVAPLVAAPARDVGPGVRADGLEPSRLDAFAENIDRAIHAQIARTTGGLSPAALAAAYWDWAFHLAASPGKQAQLAEKAARKTLRLTDYALRRFAGACGEDGERCAPCIEPLPQDRRFSAPAWRNLPYDLMWQGFLLQQQWWHVATTGLGGVSSQHEKMVAFAARQWLDLMSPSNFLATNPEALKKTIDEGGANLARGFQHFMEDWTRRLADGRPPGAEKFRPGHEVAVTPGRVVYRNRLIELIQYAPTTDMVRPEPVLIVPAWIMKYYILDLSPHNSLVRWLVAQGFTVYAISWLNPGPQDRDLGMDDYRTLGVMAALDEIGRRHDGRRVHAAGYCLGGTLLSIAAAAMGRDGDDRLQTITLLAAQSDFTEAGELTLFINESQLDFLEDLMWRQGYLDIRQMGGAFRLLRSNDLVWSYALHAYLMGERAELNDLMAWNADGTRMPYRMHSEYLRRLFLNNDLATGRYVVDGRAVALSDIRTPVFAVSTEHDHVAPWRSVFKIHFLSDADVTFLRVSGGHNVGIVADPAQNHRSYLVRDDPHGEPYVDPDAWLQMARRKNGSWWPEWAAWLAARSSAPVAARPLTDGLCDAPGTYVLQA